MDATNGFGEEYTDVHSFYFVTLHLLQLVRDCIGNDHLQTNGVTVHEEDDTCVPALVQIHKALNKKFM